MGWHNQKKHGNKRGGRLFQDATRHGGFSYSPVSNSSPKDGFMLSISNKNERVYNLDTFSRKNIDDYMKLHQGVLKRSGGFVGGWIDTKTNKIYLDISINVKSSSDAERLCKQYKQLAYYDLVKGESVYVS